jgi:superfamily II DNA or RNA helicase
MLGSEKMQLRDYQQKLIDETRVKLATSKRIIVQSPTGSGKTPVIGAMINSAVNKKMPNWLIVPRKELMTQGSAHLKKWNVPHGLIKPRCEETTLFLTHIASKQTLERRLKKIKTPPKFIVIDEAHINLDFQIKLVEMFPDAYLIGMTATPERFDGRGLSVEGGGIYDDIVYGPSIPWLADRGYLIMPEYYGMEIDGIEKLHRRGTEYDEKELAEILEKNKIYGKVADHYKKYGKVKKISISLKDSPTAKINEHSANYIPSIFFCRSVKSAEETAIRFQMMGLNIYAVHGGNKDYPMSTARRTELITALKNGDIDGLTSRDLITYGIDIPRAEYSAFLRPTPSKSLAWQMPGRIMRPFSSYKCHCGFPYDNSFSCPECGSARNQNLIYKKEKAYLFDHVNMLKIHEDPRYPGVPYIYIPDPYWNFDGSNKKPTKAEDDVIARKCIYRDYYICPRPPSACNSCEHFPEGGEIPPLFAPPPELDIELKKIDRPVEMSARPLEERREITDQISAATARYNTDEKSDDPDDEPIITLLEIAKQLGRQPLWVYHQLSKGMRAINVPVLKAIQRIKKYKSGWFFWQKKNIEIKLQRN